jgi:HEPN domain-containing protein
LGVDYPKVHDVSRVFSRRVKEKLSNVDENILVRIETISIWLGEARAPSFYFEKDYTAEDAQRAVNDATIVLDEIGKLLGQLFSE